MYMNRIKELRNLYGITQAQLAEACGHEYVQTVQRYETGARKLTVEMLEEFAEGFTKLGYPTKVVDLLEDKHQASGLDQELTDKIKMLNDDLKKEHENFLNYLLGKSSS